MEETRTNGNYTYILRCCDGSLYCGWTNNLDKRLASHNDGTGSKYTRARRPVELVYYESFGTKQEAMSREYHIKRMTRKQKLELIKSEGQRKMVIRHANTDDLDAIARLEAEAFPPSEADKKDEIRNRLLRFGDSFWLLDDCGEICAFIVGLATDESNLSDRMFNHSEMHKPNGEWLVILSVVTAESHRRRGLASMLMNRVIADTRALKRRGLVLTCKEKLLDYYAKFGFVSEGVSESTLGGAEWYQMRLTF